MMVISGTPKPEGRTDAARHQQPALFAGAGGLRASAREVHATSHPRQPCHLQGKAVRMSASAALLTGKKGRRALQALIAAPLMALGIAAGSGTAHASTTNLFRPEQDPQANGYCSVSGWPNGYIICGSGIGVTFPNGTQEVFGIGENGAMWTDWGTESNPSGWKTMGGQCDTLFATGLSNNGNYSVTLYCVAPNAGDYYSKTRSAGVSGGWGGWQDTGISVLGALPAGILLSNGNIQ
jgi:hypothetical protein